MLLFSDCFLCFYFLSHRRVFAIDVCLLYFFRQVVARLALSGDERTQAEKLLLAAYRAR